MTVEELIDKVREQYIEQIYALKAETERKSKELEVYKKALKLACWDTMCNCLHDDYYNDLLKKAREQNNENMQ